jgi:hypothetical protein
MNLTTKLLTGLFIAATLGACGNESRMETQKDVAAAKTEAAVDNMDAQREAAKEAAKSAYDLAITNADGEYKVQIERCEALEGDAQDSCKETAEAELKAAKVRAEQARDRVM